MFAYKYLKVGTSNKSGNDGAFFHPFHNHGLNKTF